MGGVLRELRAIRDGQPIDSLFGTVSMLSPEMGGWPMSLTKMRPLASVFVRVTDSTGHVYSTKTDGHGVYAFDRLPLDSYRIEEDLPAGLMVPSDGADMTWPVDSMNKDGCHADIVARPDRQAPITGVGSQRWSGTTFAGIKSLDSKD
jgi:hypothetical protein